MPALVAKFAFVALAAVPALVAKSAFVALAALVAVPALVAKSAFVAFVALAAVPALVAKSAFVAFVALVAVPALVAKPAFVAFVALVAVPALVAKLAFVALVALVGVASALANKGDALQIDDITRITAPLQGFFKGQALTAGSSGWLADQYVANQDQLDGLVNYESVILAQNQSGKLKENLYLVYPKEGIITADYPLLLLNATKRDDYNKLVTYLKSADFQREIMTKTLRRPVNSQVTLSANFPKQLLIEVAFPSSRDVVDALLVSYLNEQIKPSHTYYVLDTSGSMSGERLNGLVKAMDNLAGADTSLTGQFARFRNREKVTVLPFSTQVIGSSDFEVDTNQPESLKKISDFVHTLNATGNTAIYSALQKAYQLAIQDSKQEPDRIYSIVLMTDGQNNSGISEDEFSSFYKSAGAANIRTFPILFGEADKQTMQGIADMTNGRLFDASKDPLSFIFKEIRGYQ